MYGAMVIMIIIIIMIIKTYSYWDGAYSVY